MGIFGWSLPPGVSNADIDALSPEPGCWTCGERPAKECEDCVNGEEFCADCLADHRALEHDETDEF